LKRSTTWPPSTKDGQIGGPVTHGGRQVGGFKADDGDQVSGAGSIGSGWLSL
jgi:hypothetical protein